MKWDYRVGRGLVRLILKWIVGVRWIRADAVPPAGSVIIASNHRGTLDPPLVGCGIHRELHFFAKAELFQVPVLGRLIRIFNSIPVRRGEVDRRSLSLSIDAVKSGGGLVLFPEGTRSKGKDFLPPKLGVGMIAVRTGAPIVPVYVSGTGGGFRSLFRSIIRTAPIRVVYGDPFDTHLIREAGDRLTQYQGIANEVMTRISGLRDGLETN